MFRLSMKSHFLCSRIHGKLALLFLFLTVDCDTVTMWQELEVVERTLWTSGLKIGVQGQASHLLIS